MALQDYFSQKGCTIPYAVNYNDSAVTDDGSCLVNYYGGSYVTDLCDNIIEGNSMDNNLTACPEGFEAV